MGKEGMGPKRRGSSLRNVRGCVPVNADDSIELALRYGVSVASIRFTLS